MKYLAKRNEKGFTLIEGMLATAALAVLGFAGYHMFSDIQGQMMNNNVTSGVISARATVMQAVNSSFSWNQIVNANLPALQCVKDRTACTNGQLVKIKVVDGTGTIVYSDPNDPAVGFDALGRVCHTFPSLACPIRFNVSWTPVCSGNCINVQEKVTATLVVQSNPAGSSANDPLKNLLNTGTYSFNTFRGIGFGGLADLCQSLQGTWDDATTTCRLPLRGPCPAGQVVVGIDGQNNQKICRALWFNAVNSPDGRIGYGQCALGQVLRGFSAQGVPDCAMIDQNNCNNTLTCLQHPELCVPADGGGDSGFGGDGDGDY